MHLSRTTLSFCYTTNVIFFFLWQRFVIWTAVFMEDAREICVSAIRVGLVRNAMKNCVMLDVSSMDSALTERVCAFKAGMGSTVH